MHAGGYGLTPADAQVQRAGPAGSVAWPVRLRLAPPLGRVSPPGRTRCPAWRPRWFPAPRWRWPLVRMPGAHRTNRDHPPRPSSRLTWPTRCGSHAKSACWAAWRPAAGPRSCPATCSCGGPRWNGSEWAECSALRPPGTGFRPRSVARGGPEGECGSIPAFRSPFDVLGGSGPGTAMFLRALRSGRGCSAETH